MQCFSIRSYIVCLTYIIFISSLYPQGVFLENSVFNGDITDQGDLFRLTEGSLSLDKAKKTVLNHQGESFVGTIQYEPLYALVISKVSTKDLEIWLEEELGKTISTPITKMIATRLSTVDPQKTWEIVMQSKLFEQKVSIAQIVLYEWQKRNIQEAIDNLNSIKDRSLKSRLESYSEALIFLLDPEKNQTKVANFKEIPHRNLILKQGLFKIQKNSLDKVEGWVGKFSLSNDLKLLNFWSYAWLAQKDSDNAFERLLKSKNAGFYSEKISGTVLGCMNEHPEKAFEFLQKNPDTFISNQYGYSIGCNIAQKMGLESFKWIEKSEHSELKEIVYWAICYSLMDDYPEESVKYLTSFSIAETRNPLMGSVIQKFYFYKPESILEWIKKQPEGILKISLIQSILPTWVGRSPEECSAYLLKEYPDQIDIWTQYFREWMENDFTKALAALEKFSTSEFRENIIQSLMQSYQFENQEFSQKIQQTLKDTQLKEVALAASKSVSNGSENNDPVHEAQNTSSTNDVSKIYKQVDQILYDQPEKAFKLLMQLPVSEERSQKIGSALASIVQQNYKKGMSLYDSLQNNEDKKQALENIVSQMEYQTPKKAYEWLMTQPENLWEPYRLKSIFRSWAERDEKTALAEVEHIKNNTLREEVEVEIYQLIASKNPQKGIEISEKINSPIQKVQIQCEVARAIYKDNPKKALDWIVDMPDPTPQELRRVFDDLIKDWAEKNPELAFKYLEDYKPIEVRNALYRFLTPTFSKHNLDLGYRSLSKITDSGVYNKGLIELMEEFGCENPTLAKKILEEKVMDPETKLEAMRIFADRWSHRDLQAAKDWVLQIKEDQIRKRCLWEIAINWARSDLEGAKKFHETLPSSDLSNEYVFRIADEWAKKDPEATWKWSSSLKTAQEIDTGRREVISALAEHYAIQAFSFPFIQNLELTEKIKVYNELIPWMCNRNVLHTRDFVISQPLEIQNQLDISRILQELKERSINLVEEFVSKLPQNSSTRQQGEMFLLQQGSQGNPLQKLDEVLQETDPVKRSEKLKVIGNAAQNLKIDESIGIYQKIRMYDDKKSWVFSQMFIGFKTHNQRMMEIMNNRKGGPPNFKKLHQPELFTVENFENATRWVHAIQEEDLKYDVLKSFSSRFLSQKEEFLKWVDTLQLKEELKLKLLEELKPYFNHETTS